MCIIYRSSSDESDIVYVVGGVGCISEDVVEEATYEGIGAKEKKKGHVLTLITGGVTVLHADAILLTRGQEWSHD